VSVWVRAGRTGRPRSTECHPEAKPKDLLSLAEPSVAVTVGPSLAAHDDTSDSLLNAINGSFDAARTAGNTQVSSAATTKTPVAVAITHGSVGCSEQQRSHGVHQRLGARDTGGESAHDQLHELSEHEAMERDPPDA
jgi:hypothetical protein